MYRLQFRDVISAWQLFASGVWHTLGLTALAIIGGLLVGLIVAVLRLYGPRWAQTICIVYVEIIRNTPLLVQLFAVFFGLPALGVRLDGVTCAIVCFIVYLGAYIAEIMRAGIESIPKTQTEAGISLGLSGTQVFLHVVLVPAIKAMYPALTGQFIFFMLSTSVVSQIAVDDLFHMGSIVQAQTYRDFEIYIVIGGLYLALAVLFRGLFAAAYLLAFGARR